MGVPINMKTYKIKSKIGDPLEVRIEKIGGGQKAAILYRIIRGKDRRIAVPDKVVLFREELEQLSKFLNKEFLMTEFPE
jgi:hypothetical protein